MGLVFQQEIVEQSHILARGPPLQGCGLRLEPALEVHGRFDRVSQLPARVGN